MKYLLYFIPLLLAFSCQTEPTATEPEIVGNPAAEGFNTADSDERAIEIADQVMEAMGGRQNWEDTRYLTWNFFGGRTHFWDKQTGDVQIELLKDNTTIFFNLADESKGNVVKNDEPIAADSVAYYVEQGRKMWNNDAYWLIMPFKLKDNGVTLNYVGSDTTLQGEKAEVLKLTFDDVGDTPQNRYMIYVTADDNLVKQWDYYRMSTDSVPAFALPWTDYQQYGDILLSGNRGERQLTDIAVYDNLPTDFVWIE